ncbi:hypothetical protein GCK32_000474 [Trichostrongylus colubriformis]|uniref:Receptor expression-enhancing protein n=1 Tax=Trichostrongylus colubriformis TaxID=6319 RepID=A0AAN8ETW1_TRICO
MEELNELIYDRIHNKKWFTARGLESLSKGTGQSVELIAKMISFFLFILLITSRNWIVCNTILVVVPLLLTYVYPDEKPPTNNMRVYWISAFIVTAFDRMLETFPLYYVIKLGILLFLLVEPSCLNERLKEILKIPEKSIKQTEVLVQEETTKAPPPPTVWGRFTESIRSAIGGTAGTAPAPSQMGRESQSRRSTSQKTALVGRSVSESQQKSQLSGAPTPYDTKPLMHSKPSSALPDSTAHAGNAPGHPVGSGEKQYVQSSYVKIPKFDTKDAKASVRMNPDMGAKSAMPQTREHLQSPTVPRTARSASKRP